MSRAPKRIRSFQASGWVSIQPATSVYLRVGRMSMIWWFSTSATVVAKLVCLYRAGLHEGGLVEPDGRRLVQPFAVGVEQGFAIGGHRVIDGVPVTGQLGRHLRDRPSAADLDRRPLGRPGREQAVLGCDAVVLEHPGLLRTGRLHAAHAVLLPGQRHRCPVDGEVDVVDHRAFFDLGRPPHIGQRTTPGTCSIIRPTSGP